MFNHTFTFLISFLAGFLVAAIISMTIMEPAIIHKYQQEAIERNFAEFNSKTGEWQWKETDLETNK